MFNLVAFKKDSTRRDIPISPGTTVVIGRKPDADIRIPINDISRAHCELTLNGTKATIKDLGSSNGTYVNETRITSVTQLKAGDRISLGPVQFIVQIDGKPADVVDPYAPIQVKKPAAPAPAPAKPAPPAAAKPAAAQAKPGAPAPKGAPPSKPAAPAKGGPGKPASKPIDPDDFDIDDLSDLDLGDISDLNLDDSSDSDDLADLIEDEAPKGKKGPDPKDGGKKR